MRKRQSSISRGKLILLGLTVGALLLTLAGTAQENRGSRLRSLNGELLQLQAQLQATPGAAAGAVRAQAAALMAQRESALESLIKTNPAEALQLAFPSDVLAELGAAVPAGRARLEQRGLWEAPIEYVIEDGADFRTHRSIRSMNVGGDTLYIQFAGTEPAGLKNGDVLRVEGVRAGSQIAAYGGSIESARTANARPQQPPPPPPCTTLGPQKSIVLMVTMPDATLPAAVTQSLQQSIFFDNSQTLLSLTDFWRENSYGATSAIGDIAPATGWYTLDRVYTDDETTAIRAAALAAADPDVDFKQYNRIFIVMNGATVVSSPTYAGRGTLSCGLLSTADGNFYASTSWLKAGSMGDQNRGAHLAIHEGGHNLGLQHSRYRDFGAEALGAPGVAGTYEEYGDTFAEMGRGFGHYAAPHKARIGWLPTQVQTVTSSGVYVIEPVEAPGSVQALKIRRGTDDANALWVEYRQPLGLYDTKLADFVSGLPPNQIFYPLPADSHIFSGGLIHYADATTGSATHLLDLTPESLPGNASLLVPDDWLDPPLVGAWTDSYTGLTITTSNPTAAGLTVQVVYGTGPCVESNPTVTISPANTSAKRGQAVTFTVSVTNNDTTPCFARVFDLSASQPSGWISSLGQPALSIAAGATASTSMTTTVSANAALGTYPVNAVATSGSSTGQNTANVTVKAGK